MTPLIDVTFQLLIFFMLVNNIISEETIQMIVPNLQEPKVREIGEMDRIVVNIAPMDYDRSKRKERGLERELGYLDIPGESKQVRVGMIDFALEDMDKVRATLEEAVKQNPKVEVLLRADGGLYFQSVQPVMQAITAAGIQTVHMVAYQTEQPHPG